LQAWLEQVKATERELLAEVRAALIDLDSRLAERTRELQAEREAHARLRRRLEQERPRTASQSAKGEATQGAEADLRARVEALQREQAELLHALARAQLQRQRLERSRSYRLARALARLVQAPRGWLRRRKPAAQPVGPLPPGPIRPALPPGAQATVRKPEDRPPEASPTVARPRDGRPLFVVCVSTFNRLAYLQRFVDSFLATRGERFRWALVVGDDGSTDGTLDYLRALRPEGCQLVVLENKRRGIAGQANTMFRVAQALGFDFGAKCDDDIFFVAPGWDSLYFDAAQKTGFAHLVYHNTGWKPAKHDAQREGLVSRVSALDCMGCLYTFSPAVLERVGFLDVRNFPVRGHAHIDWTVRCCRAGFNQADTLWDAAGSESLVSMWPREGYHDLTDWNSEHIKKVLGPEERARRMAVIRDEARLLVPDVRDDAARSRSRFRLWPADQALADALLATPHFTSISGLAERFDAVFVLNLAHDVEKWALSAEALARAGIPFERAPAVDGNLEEHAARWRDYNAAGLVLPLERQLNRRLLQSPGAWAYLLSKERLLTQAKERRLQRLLALDDDAMLHKDLQAQAAEAWREVPPDWKLVYLGCTQTDWGAAVEVSPHTYRPGQSANGSYAYALHASAFDGVLASLRRADSPFDSGALREAERAHPEQTVALKPNLIIADVSRSAIRADRNMQDFAARARWELDQYLPRRFRRAVAGEHLGKELGKEGLVSVLLVCQDDEETLADALLSLRFQTHGKLEIMALDNASQDRTPTVLSWARQIDTRLRTFRVPSRIDPALGLNALIARCRGEFVAFQPASAVSTPERLEALLVCLQERTQSLGALGSALPVACPAPGDLCAAERLLQFARAHSAGPPEFPAEAAMLRRTAVDQLGGCLPLGAAGLTEYLTRLRLVAGPDALASAPEPGLVWCRSTREAPCSPDGCSAFHRELAARLRPAYVSLETGVSELQELI